MAGKAAGSVTTHSTAAISRGAFSGNRISTGGHSVVVYYLKFMQLLRIARCQVSSIRAWPSSLLSDPRVVPSRFYCTSPRGPLYPPASCEYYSASGRIRHPSSRDEDPVAQRLLSLLIRVRYKKICQLIIIITPLAVNQSSPNANPRKQPEGGDRRGKDTVFRLGYRVSREKSI